MVCRLFNRSISSCEVRETWREAIIVPLLKPGKPPGVRESYRPVSLTSCLGKWMERVLFKRMLAACPIQGQQAGFMANRSTTDVLMWLRSRIQPRAGYKVESTAVFVDFSRAFDSIDHRCLLNRLEKIGMPQYLRCWLFSFLNGRTAKVRMGYNITSRPIKTTCGVPQGSILGPLLFNYAVDGLSELLTAHSIDHMMYADDLTICATGNSRQTTLQLSMDKLASWCKENFMQVNAEKTTVTSFRSRNSPVKLTYDGHPLAESPHPNFWV